MTKLHPVFKAFLVVCFSVAFVSIAQAQATRTWVSGVGDDVNPCSRTAPCKTFAGAISKTLTDGEINCLDPGGFGAVTITKSITIDCEDTQGAILASGATGVIINITGSATADPLATVRLRGLSINGAGTCVSPCLGTHSGIRGINVSSANTRQVKLFVEELIIHGFVNEGILFNGPGGDLVVNDSEVIDNGTSGIRTLSTLAGSTGIIHVSLNQVVASLNQQGVRFEGNTFGTIKDSVASNNTLNGYVNFPASIGGAEMNIVDSIANNNKQFGVFAGGTGQVAVTRIFNVTAFSNTTNQLSVNAGGSILSNGKNHIGTPTNAPGVFTDQ
jgi:hypothetical protein